MARYTEYRRIATGSHTDILLAATSEEEAIELVVLKQLRPEFREQPESIAAFSQSVARVQSLAHPHISSLFASDVPSENEYSCAFSYMSGEDLEYILSHERLMERRIALGVTCAIAAQVADALAYWHSAHSGEAAVHGEITPSSIILGYSGRAVLLDPGIIDVRAVDSDGELVRPVRKVLYCAPEQTSHDEMIDGRADMFSLGILLHEMLTSRKLFSGPNEAAILRNICERSIPLPSIYNPEVPAILDELVLALLERDLDRRTVAATTIRDQLNELAEHFGVISEFEIAGWASYALAERREQRTAAEAEVKEAVRNPQPSNRDSSPFGSASLDGDDWPLFLPNMPKPARVSSGSINWSTDNIVLPAALGIGTGSSADTGAIATESQGNMPMPVTRRRFPILLPLAILLVIAAAASAAILRPWDMEDPQTTVAARTDDPTTTVNTGDGDNGNATAAIAIPAGEAALHLYAVPKNVKVRVDGKVVANEVGSEGRLIPVKASSSVKLLVEREGYVTHEQQYDAPESGVLPIYVTLAREKGKSGDDDAERDDKAKTDDGAKRASRDVPTRRGNSNRRQRQRRDPPKRQTSAASSEGTLLLAFRPSSAVVRVNGKVYRGPSPAQITLKSGDYDVQVSADGYLSSQKKVSIRKGNDTRLTMDLERKTGSLRVSSKPAGAEVRIDGSLRGKSPLTVEKLPMGKRVDVELTLNGYQTTKRTVTIGSGSAARISVDLQRDKAAKPDKPAAPRQPVMVESWVITKRSGALPLIRLKGAEVDKGAPQTSKPIKARMCIDTSGRVTSVKVLNTIPAKMMTVVRRALKSWRYEPYIQDGSPVPACFVSQHRLTIEFI